MINKGQKILEIIINVRYKIIIKGFRRRVNMCRCTSKLARSGVFWYNVIEGKSALNYGCRLQYELCYMCMKILDIGYRIPDYNTTHRYYPRHIINLNRSQILHILHYPLLTITDFIRSTNNPPAVNFTAIFLKYFTAKKSKLSG